MIEFRHYHSGDLFGVSYLFSAAGDALPRHEHESDTLHNIIVLLGRVRFESEVETRVLSVGDVFDFDGTREHIIECVEPGSLILNLFLHGEPADYKRLAASERRGVLAQ